MHKGVLFLLLAEFCFAAATVFAKFITNSSAIPAIEITFFRFFIGFFMSLYLPPFPEDFHDTPPVVPGDLACRS